MRKIVLLALLGAFYLNIQAQKFGYTNSNELLAELQEVKAANSSIQTFQEQLQKQGRARVEALQAKYEKLQKQEKAGELSPKQLNEEADRLKKEEEDLAKLEQEMVQKVQEKKATTLQPILDRVNKAIQDVAKEQGIAYVFDSSAGMLLYADDKLDITAAVKTKLGMGAAAPVPATKN